MTCDFHVHLADRRIFPDRFIQQIVQRMVPEGISTNRVTHLVSRILDDRDGANLLRQMDAAGIETSVLLVADYGIALGEAEASIDEIHLLHERIVKAHPDRFRWFAGVDPRRGGHGVELVRRHVEGGCHGLKLYPPCGYELDDPELEPLLAMCEAAGLPVLTHTGRSLPLLPKESRYPESLLKVIERFPKIRMILAHGPVWDLERTLELAATYPNVYFDISAFQILPDMQESLGKMLGFIADRAPTKALFGTDFPLYVMNGQQKRWVNIVQDCLQDRPHELQLLLEGNARNLLMGRGES